MENTEQSKNFDIAVNHKFFTNSLFKILDLVCNKSVMIIQQLEENYNNDAQTELNVKNTNKYKAHMKLQETSKFIKDGFGLNQNTNFDEGKIIKKIYKVLTANLDKLYPEPSVQLFQLKNENNEVVTFIPGLDINLVVKNKMFDDNDLKQLWGNIYMVYISSANMVSVINKKKNAQVCKIIPKMREKVLEYGVCDEKGGLFFNPFVGLNVETGEYDVNSMFANTDNLNNNNDVNVDNLLKMSGVDKLFNIDQLSSQIRDIKEEDITEATNNITKLIGAEGDSDINEICSELVQNVVQDLKSTTNNGGQLNMFEIAQSVASRIGGKMKPDKFNKTANHFQNFMNNSQNNLKNLKDENGNPIGEKLMGSLNMAQMMGMFGQKK